MTHHEGHPEHSRGHGTHPVGYEHHASECPYCKHGDFRNREEEADALQKYREDVNKQLSYIDRRLEELKKG